QHEGAAPLSHPAVTNLEGASCARIHDLVGNVDVPDLGRVLLGVFGEQLVECIKIGNRHTAQAKAFGDGCKVCAAEDGSGIVEPFGAQLVDLRAVGAVVEHANQQLEPVPLDRFQLLDVHQQAA